MMQDTWPDRYFNAAQLQRLAELMGRWRIARDRGDSLPPHEQAELQALVEAELRAAGERVAAGASGLNSET